ncbi:hypothetical protein BJX62DRAFT_246882 [Aspergillus germanicus]
MPTESLRFVAFRALSHLHSEYTGKCAAHQKDGKRCRSQVPRGGKHAIARSRELHIKAQDRTLDEDSIADMLGELASLTICGLQRRSAGVIEAAVKQWKDELEAEDDEISRPNTPSGDDDTASEDSEERAQFIFTSYQTYDVDTLLTREIDQLIDRRISQKFNSRDWNGERDHLYVFECERAAGMCKLGRTQNLSRRASQHDRCYPLLTQRWSFHCPNAEVFEKVVQLEFSHRRYQHTCLECGKTHIEWFKAGLEEIVTRVKVWCQLSCHLQSREKRAQLALPLAGVSDDPDRWYKWAQGWVQTWDRHDSHSAPKTPDRSTTSNAIMTANDSNIDDDVQSVPGLSPSNSAPGTPEGDYDDPPTPTPIGRSRSGRPSLKPQLAILTASQSAPNETYYTPVETMPTPAGCVLFPAIPGAFPLSPVKGLAEATGNNENGLEDILESIGYLGLM